MSWLDKRKNRKTKIRGLVEERENTLKQSIENLPEQEEVSKLKKEYKVETKEIYTNLKIQEDETKREAKKQAKLFKKVTNRKRRNVVKVVLVGALLVVAFNLAPTVMDLSRAMSGKDITMDSSSPEAQAAMAKGEALSQKLVDEGIVLMKNDSNHLPYQNEKINVFGTSSFGIRYGGGGSGATDTTKAVGLYDALDKVGLEYNKELYDFYDKLAGGNKKNDVGLIQVIKGMLGMDNTKEASSENLDEVTLNQAKEYSQNALIVVTSSGTEATDFKPEQLQLPQATMDLIKIVSENFENVTIIVNAGNAIELGFIDEYPSIKSVVWVGTPGPFGMSSLADVLVGNINPSGRLTDTYAYDSQSAPATVNFGNYKYENLKKAFINYQEGIYVGYRFYETYYENDPAGYEKAVQFPFGHGLSYTTFDWSMDSVTHVDETITMNVKVTNTGDVAGKEVVQLYYSAPYIAGGIEKSSIELGTYEKTKLLNPGESEVVTLNIRNRDMASYDSTDTQAYVLDAGSYSIKLGKSVRNIVDTYDFNLAEKVVYKENDKTNVPYENRFEYVEGDITYLSRNDWKGTWPNDEDISFKASDEVVNNIDTYESDNTKPLPTFGADNGLKLKDMVGVDKDDSKWDLFMDQFTVNELIDFVSHGAYKTIEIERLGIPKTLLMDGPAGFGYFFGSFESAGYPSELIVASTWNKELAYEFGVTAGQEAQAYGIQGWYAPAMNLHRTAQGGRNFEYFSEDPIISGTIGAAITKGAQDQGIIVFMKHFVMNDQETNARSGILVWSNEQAMRELYLKPFEITVKNTNVQGAMSSFSYLGHKWAGANEDLLKGMLRDEWGFEGFVSTDAFFGFMKAPLGIQAGNELMLDIISPTNNAKKMKKAYNKNPNAIGNALRDSVETILKTYIDNGTIVK